MEFSTPLATRNLLVYLHIQATFSSWISRLDLVNRASVADFEKEQGRQYWQGCTLLPRPLLSFPWVRTVKDFGTRH